MRIAGCVCSLLLVAGLGMSCDPGRPVILPQPHVASAVTAPLSGAIFTTNPDGSIVNENVHYASKLEVYLDGGPGPNAPKGAAALPDGPYYFQVTDPSGKVLLSEDPAKCRKVQIEGGVIVKLLNEGATYPGGKGGKDIPCHEQYNDIDGVAGPAGHHDLNTDVDYGDPPDNARVVQLMPFLDTPNNGGVYKAWIIPAEIYELTGNPETMPVQMTGKDKKLGFAPDPGFDAHKYIKTDNFKAKGKPPCPYPPMLIVKKFHDANRNGVWDAGEEEVTGWKIDVTEPVGNTNTRYTKVEVLAELGPWTVKEALPENVYQTAALLDGNAVALDPTVSVTFTDECNGETHEVIFGNHGVGDVVACKSYDKNGNGADDPGEPPVPGWKMRLEGGDLTAPIEQVTGADGCTTFEKLMPGTYTVTELMPTSTGWEATGDMVQTVTVESKLVGSEITGEATPPVVTFTNVCIGTADFGTKGYWHNKNGLAEIDYVADIAYINGLLPYSAPSDYFDAGDEPFDGYFSEPISDPAPVAAAYSNLSGILEEIAGEGTAGAEISHFLVDTNATGDPREQLAQQLLAFIFNAIHRLGGVDGAFLYNGNYVVASELINDAIAAWSSGDDIKQVEIKDILDTLNNSDAVPFIHATPCPIAY